jgi:hypothetical protein
MSTAPIHAGPCPAEKLETGPAPTGKGRPQGSVAVARNTETLSAVAFPTATPSLPAALKSPGTLAWTWSRSFLLRKVPLPLPNRSDAVFELGFATNQIRSSVPIKVADCDC